MSPLNKAGGLAWSALVALALARQDRIVQSVSQEGVSLENGKFCTLSALFNQSRCVTD